jgi:hypothetical protein
VKYITTRNHALGMVIVLCAAGCSPQRRGAVVDVDQLDSASGLIRDAVQDWYWWHGELPKSTAEIKSYWSSAPETWQPKEGWVIRFRVVKGGIQDAMYGGQLSRLEVHIAHEGDRAGSKIFRKVEDIDLRDPDRIWKPHYTGLGPIATDNGLAKTDHNIASAVAEVVWEAVQEKKRSQIKPAELQETGPTGRDLWDNKIFDRFPYVVSGSQIIVTKSGTKDKWVFPMAGPQFFNRWRKDDLRVK